MKFLGFSKIWDENSQNIFHFKNFFFFLKIYFERKFSPDFGKPQDFVFVSTGFELKSFPPGKDSKMNLSLLEKDQANCFKLDFFPDKGIKSVSSILWKYPR